MTSTEPAEDVRAVLNATFGANGAITNGDFARRVDAKSSAVRSWRSRGSVPAQKVAAVVEVVAEILGLEEATRLANACHVNGAVRGISRRRHAAGQRDLDLAGPAESWKSALRRAIRTDGVEEAPLVREVDGAAWFGLGSALLDGLSLGHPAVDGHGLPAYVEREFDGLLREALGHAVDAPAGHDGRIVVVHGPAASGRTRSVLEALRAHPVLRAAPLHVLQDNQSDDAVAHYAQALVAARGRAGKPVVTLIDDIVAAERGAGSIRASLREIARCGAIVVLIGPTEMFTGRPLPAMSLNRDDAVWLESLVSIAVEPAFDENEQVRAREVFGTLCSDKDIETLPRSLRGLAALRARIAEARSAASHDPEADLRWLAVEVLREIFLPHHLGLTVEEFGVLLEECRRSARPGQYLDPARTPRVIEWLTRPIGDTTQADNQWSIAAVKRPSNVFGPIGQPRLRLNEILTTQPAATEVVDPRSAMILGGDYVVEMAKYRMPDRVAVGEDNAGTPFLKTANLHGSGAAARLLADSAEGTERARLLEAAADAGDVEAAIRLSQWMVRSRYLDRAYDYLYDWWEQQIRSDSEPALLGSFYWAGWKRNPGPRHGPIMLAGWELLNLIVERRDWDTLHRVAAVVASRFVEPNVPALRLRTAEIPTVDDAEGFGLMNAWEHVPIFLAAVCRCDNVARHKAEFAALWIDEEARDQQLWEGAPSEVGHVLGGVLHVATVASIFEQTTDPLDALSAIRDRVDTALAARPTP